MRLTYAARVTPASIGRRNGRSGPPLRLCRPAPPTMWPDREAEIIFEIAA